MRRFGDDVLTKFALKHTNRVKGHRATNKYAGFGHNNRQVRKNLEIVEVASRRCFWPCRSGSTAMLCTDVVSQWNRSYN